MAPSSVPSSTGLYRGTLGTDAQRAQTIANDKNTIEAQGGNLADFFPPNLHEAPPVTETQNHIVPLYNIAPAPMGVSDLGLINTTGTTVAQSTNTTSVQGFFSTSDPLGVETEEFDFGTQQSYGAQLNTVLVNVTVEGQQGFGPGPDAPTGCTGFGGPVANFCPNDYWLQNVIGYSPSTHTLSFEDNIWNFSNLDFELSKNAFSGSGTVNDCPGGSNYNCEYYSTGGASVANLPYPFTVALYLNTTRAACVVKSVGHPGATSCNGQTGIDTEVYFNYTIYNSLGQRVCPATEPTGLVCGEYDDVFFNAGVNQFPAGVSPTPGAVPEYGPHGTIGSAYIQANGSAYNPTGLPTDYEMDWGIGSSSGATTGDVYANATVGINYCTNADVSQSPGTYNQCTGYTAPPSAFDFGSETGETSSGANGYWTPQNAPNGPLPAFLHVSNGNPVAHIVTGPSLLSGLWNATGVAYPNGEGAHALSYASIAPANAWVGIAMGAGVTNQSYFQVAPTFGFWSYWAGSGGSAVPTTLGSDLLLEPGTYTIEVMLSGYDPQIETLVMTSSSNSAPYPTTTPSITLVSDPSTGAYTLDWAFSNSDLQNLTATPGTPCGASVGNPCDLIDSAPNVGAPYGPTGSLSWLFSNLNDYLFIQWIGVYINQTTAYAGFTAAPSMPMVYPSWQDSTLSGSSPIAGGGAPHTNYFQYYFFHTQNFFVEGGTHLAATWIDNAESGQLYGVICNTCGNVVFAGNTFAVADEGVEFTGGGTSAASLPYLHPAVNPNGFLTQGAPQLTNTRNVVWGNTFVPGPTPGFSGIYQPTRDIAVAESWDRIYNNEFNALASNSPTNLSISDTGTSISWWNATCVSGYAPLKQETYPGSPNPGNGVCEPLSYSQSIDGIAMTGAIDGATYQGGNAWSDYGNEPNPYANIPFVARTTTETGTAGISAANVTRAGDYAPLITNSVSELTFKETGLPSSATATAFEMSIANSTGYGWFNETATSTVFPASVCAASTVCLNFYVPFGTYSWAASSVGLTPARAASPATGTVSFTTPSTLVSVSFVFGYTVTFTETGLPASTRWYVNITGQTSLTGTTTTLSKTLPNGTYTFSAATVNKEYAPSYNPHFTVSGGPVAVAITFTFHPYLVTFTESGLPSGTSWNVAINGGAPSSSVTTTITFEEANGTYHYAVGLISGYHAVDTGSFVVNGNSPRIHVTFAPTTYTVKFTETGLTSAWHTTWCVTYNTTTTCSTGSSIAFTGIRNGSSYTYSIGHVANYSLDASYTGSGTISGGGGQGQIVKTVAVPWKLVKYTVTFTESGLSAHGSWQVTMDGKTTVSTGSKITFSVSNGSYAFTAVAAGYSSVSNPPSPAVVNGGPTGVTVTFTATVPHGSPAGTLVAVRA
jgi:hypothetical protein